MPFAPVLSLRPPSRSPASHGLPNEMRENKTHYSGCRVKPGMTNQNNNLSFPLSMINSGFFLKPSSLRRPGSQIRALLICAIRLVVTSKVDRRRFCGETEGVLLCLARKPRQTEPAAKAAGEPKVNSPSPRFAGSSLREGAKIFGKPLFIVSPFKANPLFIFSVHYCTFNLMSVSAEPLAVLWQPCSFLK